MAFAPDLAFSGAMYTPIPISKVLGSIREKRFQLGEREGERKKRLGFQQ